jgi:hypothetical protein
MNDDQSAIVIPFGKHKGSTVAELLVKDPQYVEWITAQGWFAQRFAEVHAAIISRGAGTDDTPEHNALQARFLDPVFREACLRLLVPDHLKNVLKHGKNSVLNIYIDEIYSLNGKRQSAQDMVDDKRRGAGFFDTIIDAQRFLNSYSAKISAIESKKDKIRRAKWYLSTGVKFEISGVDVDIHWDWFPTKNAETTDYFYETLIELKPEIGDDYPTVMRQMQRLKCNALVAQTFTGRGVSETTLREMMEANDYSLIWVREIEAEAIAITAASRPKARRRLKK